MAEDKDLAMRIYVKKSKANLDKFAEIVLKFCQNAKLTDQKEEIFKELKSLGEENNPANANFLVKFKGTDAVVRFENYKDFWCFAFTINYGYENLKDKKEYFEFFKTMIQQIKPFAVSVGWFLFEIPQDSFSLYPEFESRNRKVGYLGLYENPDKRCQELVFNDMNYFSKELLDKADNKKFFESREQISKIPFEDGVISIDKNGFFEEIVTNE